MISNGMRMSKGLSKWNKGNISQCPNGNIDNQKNYGIHIQSMTCTSMLIFSEI